MTAADRPSVTDDARADRATIRANWEHFCNGHDVHPSDMSVSLRAFNAGWRAADEWAAGRAETTTEATERIARQIAASTAMTGRDALELVKAVQAMQPTEATTAPCICIPTGSLDFEGPDRDCPTHGETTTATVEDAIERARIVITEAMRDGSATTPEDVALALDAHGLLATARTRPTCGSTTNDAGPCVLDPDHITVSAHTGPSGWGWNDDVTMARFGDDDEEADQ